MIMKSDENSSVASALLGVIESGAKMAVGRSVAMQITARIKSVMGDKYPAILSAMLTPETEAAVVCVLVYVAAQKIEQLPGREAISSVALAGFGGISSEAMNTLAEKYLPMLLPAFQEIAQMKFLADMASAVTK